MHWPEYFDHPNLEHTDIVHLPEWYCLQYGLSLGDTILVHMPHVPEKGCLLTVGWDFVDNEQDRVCLGPERRKKIDELFMELGEWGESLSVVKPELKEIQDPTGYILVERASTVQEHQEEIFRKKARFKITTWAEEKRAINYNQVYTHQNSFSFVCISQQDWGILDHNVLERIDFLFTSQFNDWQELTDNYRQVYEQVIKLEKSTESCIMGLDEALQEVEKKIQKGKDLAGDIAGQRQARRLANGLLYNIVDDFYGLKDNLNALSMLWNQAKDDEKKQIIWHWQDDSHEIEYDINQFPEVNFSVRDYHKELEDYEQEIAQEKKVKQDILDQLTSLKEDQGLESHYLEIRIEAYQNTNDSLSKLFERAEELEIKIATLQKSLDNLYLEIEEDLTALRKKIKKDLRMLTQNIEDLANDQPMDAPWKEKLTKLFDSIQHLSQLMKSGSDCQDAFRDQAKLVATMLFVLQENISQSKKEAPRPRARGR